MSHYNAQPIIDVYGSVEGTDLASVARKVEQIIDDNQAKLPRGSQIFLRGQIETMHSSFQGLVYRAAVLDRAGLCADRGELPELARPVHHHRGAARRAGRDCVDAVPYRDPHQRSRAHRFDHVHGRGHGELDPGGQLRQGADGRGPERGGGGAQLRASRASGPSL